jgi:threonine synthase
VTEQVRLPAAGAAAAGGRSTLVCGGCGTLVDDGEPYPFRCPRAGDGGDHVLRRVLDLATVRFPTAGTEPNPFVRFRGLLHAHHLALAGGMDDAAFVGVVRELDQEVRRVDGRGFTVTPLVEAAALAEAAAMTGPLYVKDETGGVSGSHKARHLFGILLHLEVVERLGTAPGSPAPRLAIASCGNAALAAAVVAKAAGRPLEVFVPTDAEPAVLERLRQLGAEVVVCERAAGVHGDPTYLRLMEAIAGGSLPFTCQGNENGLAVEGGVTLGYEMAAELARRGRALDHVVVQVGGGALASAVSQGLAEAAALGVLPRPPRLHTVQTEGAWPLVRAFKRLEGTVPPGAGREQVVAALRGAAAHRSDFMWPWEATPHSVARGILDDETYDWLAVCEAMLSTGGRAVVVGEDELVSANAMAAETTRRPVDETGSAGLAGLLRLRREGAIAAGDSAAVLFTGARR